LLKYLEPHLIIVHQQEIKVKEIIGHYIAMQIICLEMGQVFYGDQLVLKPGQNHHHQNQSWLQVQQIVV
jgi:hypothetical protein